MPTIYKWQECLTINKLEQYLHSFVRESAKEIPTLLKQRQAKIDNYELSI